MSWQPCLGNPILVVLSWQSCPGCLVLPVLFCRFSCLSYSACLAMIVILFCLSPLWLPSCCACPLLNVILAIYKFSRTNEGKSAKYECEGAMELESAKANARNLRFNKECERTSMRGFRPGARKPKQGDKSMPSSVHIVCTVLYILYVAFFLLQLNLYSPIVPTLFSHSFLFSVPLPST